MGTYPPRKCGIAIFTKDLVDAMDRQHVFHHPEVIAINPPNTSYPYDKRVRFQIREEVVDDYIEAAQFINSSHIDLVNLQHEFGIFG
ncbi:MAG: glycosyl transferase, partial [Candidatus Ranarchaeia archaeon]